MRHVVLSLVLALTPFVAGAQSKEDAAAVRKVIEAQIDAFRKDDAQRAFSYATDGIQLSFGTPEIFMAMVREQYAAVYRPRTVAFLAPVYASRDELVQPVWKPDSGSGT